MPIYNYSFKEENVPPALWSRVEALRKDIETFQKECEHAWLPVTEYDPDYNNRLRGVESGEIIIKGFVCLKCRLCKPIEGCPSIVCRKCAGKMQYVRSEQSSMDCKVRVYKCKDCGHEFGRI